MSPPARLGVTFVIPTFNAEAMLDRCLSSIRAQQFSDASVEIIIADGGSTDSTRAIAERHDARVVDNVLKRAEPGVKLGFREASHPIRVVMAADNGLPTTDWLDRVVGAFEADPELRGVYTHVVDGPTDSLFCRYFNRLHADPYNWFVYGEGPTNPALFADVYPVREQGEDYVVYDLAAGPRPLLAMAQGFAMRGDLPGDESEEDDIAPLWDLIERGEKLGYVDVGVLHETVAGVRDFHRKFRYRTAAALSSSETPYRARAHRLSRGQRIRQLLWLPYSVSLLAPLAQGLRRAVARRDPLWLIHPIGSLVLTGAMVQGGLDARRERHAAAASPEPSEESTGVVVMTGPLSTGVSGGDVHALRLCDEANLKLIAPPTMRSNCPPQVADQMTELRTPLDRWVDFMPAYLVVVTLRAVATIRRTRGVRGDAVAASHFFHDVIPVVRIARRGGGRAVVYVYHVVGDSGRERGLRSAVSVGLERLSLRVARRGADVVFVDNEETREGLLQRGFDPQQLVMTENAYDPLQELPARSKTDPPTIVFIGRFVEVKGVWDVLRLANTLRDRGVAAKIQMLGDGPLRPQVIEAVEREGLADAIALPGFVAEAEKWEHLRGASLFIAPSREEGWGIAVGEALTAGVPSVIYDLPAYGHFGARPERVPIGDAAALCKRVIELLLDAELLASREAALADSADGLPMWGDVLAAERAAVAAAPKRN